jgi:hypothetical protein
VVTGTAEPGSSVQIFTSDTAASCGGTPAATAVADATGQFSASLSFQYDWREWVRYHVTAWATDRALNRSACSADRPYIWDELPPQAGSVYVDYSGSPGWTNSTSQVTVRWSGFSDQGGVALASYRVSISTSDCSSPIAPEVLVSGSTSSVTLTGLSLQESSGTYINYIPCVQAFDQAGNSVTHSTFFTVDATPPVLVSRTPAPGATEADSWAVDIEVTDDNLYTFNAGYWMTLEDSGGTVIPLTLDTSQTFGSPFHYLAPQRLQDGMTYTAHLTGVADVAGNVLPSQTWAFTVSRAWRAPVKVPDPSFASGSVTTSAPFAAQVTATDELHLGVYTLSQEYAARIRPSDLVTTWSSLTSSTPRADVSAQTMAFNSAGNGVALYTRRYNSTGPRQVAMSFHEMIGSGSAWWWEDFKLDPNATGEPSSLSAAVDSVDVSYMVWVKQAGAGADLYASRFAMRTFTVDPPALLETAAGAVSQAAVVVNDQDLPVAAWLQVGSTGTVDVMSARYVAGSGWTVPAPIESQTGDATALRLAVVDGGQVLAMWQRGGEIWWNRFLPGTGWGAEARLGTTSSAAELQLSGRHGTAIAVWRQDPSGLIQAAVFAGAAGTWSAASTISAAGCFAPSVSLDGAGRAGAVFFCGSGSVADVMSARYAGGSWGTQPRMVAAAQPDPQGLQILLSESEDGWALWARSTPLSLSPELVMTPYR